MRKDKLIYLISPWRFGKFDTSYIAFLDYTQLSEQVKEAAAKVADFEGKDVEDYMYFTVVHRIENEDNIVIPERTKDGKNITMCQRKYMMQMEKNHNISYKKMAYIGYLPRRSVWYLVRSVAGIKGLLKINFNGGTRRVSHGK